MIKGLADARLRHPAQRRGGDSGGMGERNPSGWLSREDEGNHA
jgi:hypothetical protein